MAGLQVGLELTGWVVNRQIADAKADDAIEQSIRKAIHPEPPNNTEHIHIAWLIPQAKALTTTETPRLFRTELMVLVGEVDRRWNREMESQSPQGCWWTDLSRYPTLGKYLSLVEFFPRSSLREWSSTEGWLIFLSRGGSYSELSMVEALLVCIGAKIRKYSGRPPGLDAFHLLIHYDLAWAYNTPAETLHSKFADAARISGDFIGDDPGVFGQIFLFVPHTDGPQRVFQLYPYPYLASASTDYCSSSSTKSSMLRVWLIRTSA